MRSMQKQRQQRKMRQMKMLGTVVVVCFFLLSVIPAHATAEVPYDGDFVRERYEEYQERFESIARVEEIAENGFVIDETQMFPVIFESFGEAEVTFIPAMDESYHRLAIFLADAEGNIIYRYNQFETNFVYRGELEQPTESIASVSFQDVNEDGRTDIIMITKCVNDTGDYAGESYKVGDVLFQGKQCFYRDWRVSDKINRFGMNRSANCIRAFVRDGHSAEILYTATTLNELEENGFIITQEQCYTRNFEKLGRLTTVPGIFRISEYDIFMIYLVDAKGDIVWCFQPMEDYDNLYSLKGTAGKDVDGDGMKDLVVLARYSREGEDGRPLVESDCAIYYQRTGGFDIDKDFENAYTCTDEDTMEDLVAKIREYWGWSVEE